MAQPERLNSVLKAGIPHNLQVGVRHGPVEPSVRTSINYANIVSLNEALAPNLRYFQQVGHDRDLLKTVLHSIGHVRPYFHEVASTIVGGAIGVQGTDTLRGFFPTGPLLDQLEAIRVDAQVAGTTPFMIIIEYKETVERRPFVQNGPYIWNDGAGEWVVKDSRTRHSMVMFTKNCIVQAQGGVALFIRGIPAGNGQPAAVYGSLDFQVQAGRDIFRTITQTAAIGFGTSFTKAPAHAEFENGAVAGRDMAQFWPRAAGALPQNFTRYTVADDYYNFTHDDVVVGAGAGAEVVSPPRSVQFRLDIEAALTGEAFVFKLPVSFFDRDTPVVRSELLGVNPADNPGTRLTEPLLSFCGMSVFRPSSIYPTVPKLPAFIQDYRMVLSQPPSQRMLLDTVDSQFNIAGVTDRLITHVVPVGEYEVTVRSENGFDQTNKELQSASIPFPYTQDFFSTYVDPTGFPPLTRCECSTTRGPPDYVFLRLQRLYANNLRTAPFEATIKTLRMFVRTHNIRSISDLDEMQLYQLTRRNSNFRADTLANFRKYGAVLIRRQDVGSWPDWDGEKDDPFTIEFQVSDYAVYDPGEASGYPAAITDVLDSTPLRVAVTFIYSKHRFSGRYNECKFDFTTK